MFPSETAMITGGILGPVFELLTRRTSLL